MNLVEFLTARLDERYAAAKAAYDEATDYRIVGPPMVEDHFAWWKPAEVMADIDAKRRIMAFHSPTDLHGSERTPIYCDFCDSYGMDEGLGEPDYPWPCEHLRLVASPYADHPDYDVAWRP